LRPIRLSSKEGTLDDLESADGEARRKLRAVGCRFVLAFFAVGLLSCALVLLLVFRQAPPPAIGAAFFALFLLFFVVLLTKGRAIMRGLARALPSPERLAARQLVQVRLPNPAGLPSAGADDWPTVPKLARPNSPGRTLAVSVPAEGTPAACALACLVPFTAIWFTLLLGVALPPVVRGHLRGRIDWCGTLFLIPFALAGLVMLATILSLVFQWVVNLLVGRIRVELSAHPLQAGGRALVLVEQAGPLPLRDLRVSLVCQESATSSAGSRATTVTKEVSVQELADAGAGLDTDLAGGAQRTLDVPASAMHSFASGHNKITWKLVVRGRVAGLPSRSDFPVLVYPAGWEEGA
jgi:hypothetical protein